MPTLSRRLLLGGATVLPLVPALRRQARAAEFSYKLGTNLPAVHPLNICLKQAADRIREATGGRLEIAVFPSSQLGSDTDMLGQTRAGALEFQSLSPIILSTFVPLASISGIGFAFKITEQALAAMDGGLGALVRAEIAKHNLIAFDRIFDSGFRQVTSSVRPIRTPDDFRGMKIRVPPSPLWTSMFKDFGAGPTTITFNETYSALQTKVVDGQENPLPIIEAAKLYEVQKYCSLTNHMWDGFWILANPRMFQRLPADIQDTVQREFADAAIRQRADLAKLNADLRESLARRGLTFNETEQEAFRQVLVKAGFYADWKAKYGDVAWQVLEAAAGSLA